MEIFYFYDRFQFILLFSLKKIHQLFLHIYNFSIILSQFIIIFLYLYPEYNFSALEKLL